MVVVASALPWPQDGADAAQAEGDEKNVDARHHNRRYYSNYYYPSKTISIIILQIILKLPVLNNFKIRLRVQQLRKQLWLSL